MAAYMFPQMYPVTTMADVDRERTVLQRHIESVRGAERVCPDPADCLPCLAKRTCVDVAKTRVEERLAAYHHQRSPEFLLKLLAHAATPCPGIECPDCDVIEALAKEAPSPKGKS